MLQYLHKCKCQTLLTTHIKNHKILINLLKFTNPISNYSSLSHETTKDSTFTVSYLKKTCGLSGKSLIRASSIVFFDSSNRKPNLVLKLFQSYGFSKTQITKIVSSRPNCLLCDAHHILKPKLDLLLSVFGSNAELTRIVSVNPNLVVRSLNKYMIPFLNMLDSLLGSRENTVAAIIRKPRMLSCSASVDFLPNVELLQTLGVPVTRVLCNVGRYGVIGSHRDKFKKAVFEVKKMGFDPLHYSFLNAVTPMLTLSASTWKSKLEAYRSLGFSDNEFVYMFKKQPAFILRSVDKIRETVEFFVGKLRWSPSKMSTAPNIFIYSLEKRVIPRCAVLQALALRNVTNISYTVTVVLPISEKKFLKNYVIKYMDGVPEVMDAYQGKLRFDEYNFPSVRKKQDSAKLLTNVALTPSIPVSQILEVVSRIGATDTQHDKFKKAMLKVKEMGFDPSHYSTYGVKAMASAPASTWKPKFELFRSFGFSDDEFLYMFLKQPLCMSHSTEKIRRALEFFMGKLCWTPSMLSTAPNVLHYSLEKTVIPRCSVLQALWSRKGTKRSYMLTSVLMIKEKAFMEKFVTKYMHEFPEVMDAYQGKLSFDEYNFPSLGNKQVPAS